MEKMLSVVYLIPSTTFPSPPKILPVMEQEQEASNRLQESLCTMVQAGHFRSVQFSRSVVSDSLRPHELQHTRPPCPSPTPGVHSNSRPSSQWFHPAILFILFMGFSRQEYRSGLPFPSPADHVLSEISTMTRLSWVALHGMVHSFTGLDKAVIHVISLVRFSWLWFSFCLPSDGWG